MKEENKESEMSAGDKLNEENIKLRNENQKLRNRIQLIKAVSDEGFI